MSPKEYQQLSGTQEQLRPEADAKRQADIEKYVLEKAAKEQQKRKLSNGIARNSVPRVKVGMRDNLRDIATKMRELVMKSRGLSS